MIGSARSSPGVFGHLGLAAIPVLGDYLTDDAHDLWARVGAADGLSEIGTRHPDAPSDAVDALTETLERFGELDSTLNAFVIRHLVDLDAVEAAPLMACAFEADRVDLQAMGDWEGVQIRVGLLESRMSGRDRLCSGILRT